MALLGTMFAGCILVDGSGWQRVAIFFMNKENSEDLDYYEFDFEQLLSIGANLLVATERPICMAVYARLLLRMSVDMMSHFS